MSDARWNIPHLAVTNGALNTADSSYALASVIANIESKGSSWLGGDSLTCRPFPTYTQTVSSLRS